MTIYSSAIPVVYQAAILCAGILLLGAFLARRKLVSGEGLIPDEGMSLRNIFEVLTENLYGMAESTMGEHARTYFPICAAIFFFILIGNVMGLVPGVGGPTSNVNVAAAWAVIAFLVYNYIGIKTHGWKYVYQFMGPSLWEPEIGGQKWHVRVLAPLFLPLELLLHGARMLTLTVRLVANMFADHTVVAVWISIVPIAVPAIFMGLGLLVAFLQAFVFSLLTMIYIGSALEEAH